MPTRVELNKIGSALLSEIAQIQEDIDRIEGSWETPNWGALGALYALKTDRYAQRYALDQITPDPVKF